MADGGSFYLTFRGHTTEALSFGATPAQLQAALNNLPSITTPPSQDWSQGVLVETSSRVLCDKDGVYVDLKFLQDYGELPLVLANVDQLSLTTGTSCVGAETTLGSSARVVATKIHHKPLTWGQGEPQPVFTPVGTTTVLFLMTLQSSVGVKTTKANLVSAPKRTPTHLRPSTRSVRDAPP